MSSLAPVIDAYDCYESLVRILDRNAVKAAVEHAGMVTAREGALFELLCLFNSIDALRCAGWSVKTLRLFAGRLRITGTRPDLRPVWLHYQSSPNDMSSSTYRAIQSSHAFPQPGDLRPDMIVNWEAADNSTKWLLVECKLSKQGVVETARQELFDLLAYRRAFTTLLDDQPGPYGLGIAWGEAVKPDGRVQIMLATPDSLVSTLASTVT